MGPFAIHIFGIFAILALAWALFIVWLIFVVFRAIWTGICRLTGMGGRPRTMMLLPRRCTRLRCLTDNPPQANFCRRCGSPLVRPLDGGRYASAHPSQWVSSPSRL